MVHLYFHIHNDIAFMDARVFPKMCDMCVFSFSPDDYLINTFTISAYMVRTYKRKTDQHKLSESIIKAIKEFRNKIMYLGTDSHTYLVKPSAEDPILLILDGHVINFFTLNQNGTGNK